MLGIFDSGLGGLSVVRRVRERLPLADILFFADQAHVPYGERDEADLAGLLHQNIAWLNAAHVDRIVMGCNTTCAIAAQTGWPPSVAPIMDLIEAASIAAQRARVKHVGIVATRATLRTGAYAKAVRARNPHAQIVEVAAPALVPLVEAGKAGTQEAQAAVTAVCAQLPHGIDSVLLACTHYPILDAHFADALGEGVLRIDPALEQAEQVTKCYERSGGSGETVYVTNGDVDLFRTAVGMITGDLAPKTMSATAFLAERSDLCAAAKHHG